jgi:hypothetical protein
MAMPRKNLRQIACDGREYHWRFTGGRNADHREPSLTIQSADGKGGMLIVRQSTWPDVTPSYVAAVIVEALGKGWCPARPGGPMMLIHVESKAPKAAPWG